MPKSLEWDAERDDIIREGREAQQSWDVLALVLGISRWSAIQRGRAIGVGDRLGPVPQAEKPDLGRPALPPGDPVTWGAITEGTTLEGAAYRYLDPLTGEDRGEVEREAA